MSDRIELCAGCGHSLIFDYIGDRHAGCSITIKERPERKPRMSEARRKILNLLEYILEVDTSIDTVYNAFALHVAQRDEDHCWVNDEEWAQWFEEYAHKLAKKSCEEENNRVDST